MNHMGHSEKVNLENYQSAPCRHVIDDMEIILERNRNGYIKCNIVTFHY